MVPTLTACGSVGGLDAQLFPCPPAAPINQHPTRFPDRAPKTVVGRSGRVDHGHSRQRHASECLVDHPRDDRSGRRAGAEVETAARPRKEKPRAPRRHGRRAAPSDETEPAGQRLLKPLLAWRRRLSRTCPSQSDHSAMHERSHSRLRADQVCGVLDASPGRARVVPAKYRPMRPMRPFRARGGDAGDAWGLTAGPAAPAGGRAVAGSNPVSPIERKPRYAGLSSF